MVNRENLGLALLKQDVVFLRVRSHDFVACPVLPFTSTCVYHGYHICAVAMQLLLTLGFVVVEDQPELIGSCNLLGFLVPCGEHEHLLLVQILSAIGYVFALT